MKGFNQAIAFLVGVGIMSMVAFSVGAADRRGEKLEPPTTSGPMPGDWTAIDWAIPIDRSDAGVVASPERTQIAVDILASMLSDPTFRYEVRLWYEHYLAKGHEREEASFMAKAQAAQIGYAFADALILAAE